MHLSSAPRTVRAFAVASLVALVPRAAHGQRLVPGDTLRIASAHSTYRGLLLSRDSASLVMLRPRQGDTLRFLQTDITSAEVLRGRQRAGAKTIGKGALIGLGIGSALAAVTLLNKSGNQETREMSGFFAIVDVAFGTAMGTVIGTVASFRRVDYWLPFDPRSPW